MGSRQRYVIIGILALAVIVAVALAHGFGWVFARFGWDDFPVLSRELPISAVIAYAIALGAAIFAIKYPPIFKLANEVVDELAKVTWPTREETGSATVVVIVTVLISSAYLGIFDAVWLTVTDWILGVPSMPS